MRLRVMLPRFAILAVLASALAPAATASAPGIAVNPAAAPATAEAAADDAAGRVTVNPGDTPDAEAAADCAPASGGVAEEVDNARNALLGDGVITRSSRTPVDPDDLRDAGPCAADALLTGDPTPEVSVQCIDPSAYSGSVTFPEIDQGSDWTIGVRPGDAVRPQVKTNALEATEQAGACVTDNTPESPCTQDADRTDCDVVTFRPPRASASDVHGPAEDVQAIANDPPQPALPDMAPPATPTPTPPATPPVHATPRDVLPSSGSDRAFVIGIAPIKATESDPDVPQPRPHSGSHQTEVDAADNQTATANHTAHDATPLAYHAPDDPGEPYAPRPLPPKPLQGEGTDAPVHARNEDRRDPDTAQAASASTTPAPGAGDDLSLTERVAKGTALALLLLGPIALYHRLRGARVLKQRARARMLDAIRERPGLTTREAAEAADVTYTTADYHLKRLRDEGFVATEKHGGRIRYYVSGDGFASDRRTAHAVLQSDEVRGIYQEVQKHPQGISKSALARSLGVARSTVDWHLRGLLDAGLVTRHRKGREVRIHADGNPA